MILTQMTIFLVVLYLQDLAQVSNSNILVPPQLYPTAFIFVDFLDSGILCQVAKDISLSTNTI